MKKRLLAFAAAALALAMSLSVLTGCNLVTTDNQRDMDQVVAEVSIGEGAPVEKIYKKDLVVMYLNYGVQYVQQYGYSMKQAFETVMNNLVNNVLLVQSALDYYAAEKGVTTDKFNVDNYLTDEEKERAVYNTNKSFNDLIENYIDDDDEEEKTENSSDTPRTTPTGAANYAETIKGIDKFWEEYVKAHPAADEEEKEFLFYKDYNSKGYLSKGIVTGFDDDMKTNDLDRKKAYNKVLKALDVNGLVGDGFDFEKGSVYDTEYYSSTLKSQKESIILQNYEKVLKYGILSEVSYTDLEARYKEMYDAQKNSSVADFETAISDASSSKPVVYSPYSGYGYVYNLLLGVDDVQDAQIKALETNSKAEYKAERAKILAKTTARDLRSSWITAGYDYDFEKNIFTGDYSFASEENALTFKGEAEWLNEADKDKEDYKAKYGVKSVLEYDLAEFVKMMDEYLYGSVQANTANDNYYKVASATAPEEFDEMVNDLLFAFSTDGGSLNTYQGYVVKPTVDVDGTETYVEEFAAAARDVLKMGRGSYIIVGTDFGYHIIFNSRTITANSGYATLGEYLDTLGVDKGEKTWAQYYDEMIKDLDKYAEDNDTDFYLYQLQQAYVSNILSTRLNEKQTEIICKYKVKNDDGEYDEFNKDYVKIYTDRYSEYLRDN